MSRSLSHLSRASILAGIGLLAFSSVGTIPVANAAAVNVEQTQHAADNHVIDNKQVETKYSNFSTVDLFDYYVTGDGDGCGDNQQWSSMSDSERNSGINNGHVLKFGRGMKDDRNSTHVANKSNVNAWTTDAQPMSGIVQSKLGDDGYPVMSDGLGGESLSYLFDKNATDGKKVYNNVNGLLQLSDDGYFYYDSQENFAEYDADTNSINLYDTWGTISSGSSPYGQFLPFNNARQVFEATEDVDDNLQQNESFKSTNDCVNHYFGMHMNTAFTQWNGGMTSDGTAPVKYNFSGDDDVWIYIDGVLVGDLGGIHDMSSLEIDFSTGQVLVYGDAIKNVDGAKQSNNRYDAGEKIYLDTTLRDLFDKADIETSDSDWNGDTFADYSQHTIDMFYLERGNTDSNLALSFNMQSADLDLDKSAPAHLTDAKVGDEIEYRFEIENTGTVPLDNAQVSYDSLFDDAGISLDTIEYDYPNPNDPGHIDPGETIVGTATYKLRSEDFENGEVVNKASADAVVTGLGDEMASINVDVSGKDEAVTELPDEPTAGNDIIDNDDSNSENTNDDNQNANDANANENAVSDDIDGDAANTHENVANDTADSISDATPDASVPVTGDDAEDTDAPLLTLPQTGIGAKIAVAMTGVVSIVAGIALSIFKMRR